MATHGNIHAQLSPIVYQGNNKPILLEILCFQQKIAPITIFYAYPPRRNKRTSEVQKYREVPQSTVKYEEVQGSPMKYTQVPISIRKYKEVYGSTQKYMEVYGSTQKYMEVYGSTQKYMEV
jgi:hypothetical protein